MSTRDLWIVKLGGSLLHEPRLASWLERVAAPAPFARLVVPGGGPFADLVRELQPRLGLGGLAAHRMAILGMQQTGLALAAMEPRLGLVETMGDVAALTDAGGAAVWLPWRMAGRDAGIPATWNVTSDSLALWLARRSAAVAVLLVKAAPLAGRCPTIAALTADGLLDAAFAGLRRSVAAEVMIADVGAEGPLQRIVQDALRLAPAAPGGA